MFPPNSGLQWTRTADLVEQLLVRLDRLAPHLKDVSLAAEVQLLKRDLARGHRFLSARAEDNNFLSVITLVEAALASLTWKGYSPAVLDALPGLYRGPTRGGVYFRGIRRCAPPL